MDNFDLKKYLAEGKLLKEEEWFDKADRGEVEYDDAEEEFNPSDMEKEYYPPSDSYEWFDGKYYYNSSGQQLRDPEEYDDSEEGYTPFGDE